MYTHEGFDGTNTFKMCITCWRLCSVLCVL